MPEKKLKITTPSHEKDAYPHSGNGKRSPPEVMSFMSSFGLVIDNGHTEGFHL